MSDGYSALTWAVLPTADESEWYSVSQWFLTTF